MALSIEQTGKYTSERHELAKQSGKLTAGQVAQILNKQFKLELKITAAELRPFATEWHHSGFYKPAGSKSTMGKTYFFDLEEISLEKLFEKIISARQECAHIESEPEIDIHYFYTAFKTEYGCRGRKYWQPIAGFGFSKIKPSELHTFLNGKKTEITKEEYYSLHQFAGRFLESYETYTNFKDRMLNGNKS